MVKVYVGCLGNYYKEFLWGRYFWLVVVLGGCNCEYLKVIIKRILMRNIFVNRVCGYICEGCFDG